MIRWHWSWSRCCCWKRSLWIIHLNGEGNSVCGCYLLLNSCWPWLKASVVMYLSLSYVLLLSSMEMPMTRHCYSDTVCWFCFVLFTYAQCCSDVDYVVESHVAVAFHSHIGVVWEMCVIFIKVVVAHSTGEMRKLGILIPGSIAFKRGCDVGTKVIVARITREICKVWHQDYR